MEIFLSVNLVIVFTVFSCLLGVLFFRNQFLISLLSLEFIVLSLYVLLIIVLGQFLQSFSITFYILVFGASEASLGLSLLVVITRLKGSDVLAGLCLYKC